MLYGSKEKLLEIVRKNPDLLKSISEDFRNDPDFLKAAGVFNSELTDGEEESQIITEDIGEIIDLIVDDYKSVADNVKNMKRLQLDTINIISFLDEVDLDEEDIKKLFGKLENNIEKMKKLRTQNNEKISKNLSSAIIESELTMESYKDRLTNDVDFPQVEAVSEQVVEPTPELVAEQNSESVIESTTEPSVESTPVLNINSSVTPEATPSQVPNIFEEGLANSQVRLDSNQYILGRNSNGNYYLVIDSNMTPESLENVRAQIRELKPELDSTQFIIDYGNALLDNNLEVLLNGYAKVNEPILDNAANSSYEANQDLTNSRVR